MLLAIHCSLRGNKFTQTTREVSLNKIADVAILHVASGLQKHVHVAIHVLLVVLTSAGPIIFYMSTYSMLRSTDRRI